MVSLPGHAAPQSVADRPGAAGPEGQGAGGPRASAAVQRHARRDRFGGEPDFHGRGIDAEAAGDLHVAGSARDPQVTGGFDLLRGSLSVLGKRLVFTRGRVRFGRDVTPELALVAETSAGGVTARASA